MSFTLKEFVKGIVLRGEATDASDIEGSIFYNTTSKTLKTFLDLGSREIVTNSQAQTLTNKTIDYNLNTILNLPGGGGGGGVNLDLSNITATNIPDGSNLLSTSSNYFTIGTQNKSTATGETRLATGMIFAGGTGNSGIVQIYSGIQQGTGQSGMVYITSGPIVAPGIGSTTGALDLRTGRNEASGPGVVSGGITVKSGKTRDNASGTVFISTGSIDNFQDGYDNEVNASPTGIIQINTGIIRNTVSPSRTGGVLLASGSSSSLAGSGSLTLQSGRIVAGGTGNSGQVALFSGPATESPNASSGNTFVCTGDVLGTGTSGLTSYYTGTAVNGNSGAVSIFSGNISGTGNSGNLLLQTGSVTTGTRGTVTINGRELYVNVNGLSQTAIITNQYGTDFRKAVKIRPDTAYSPTQNMIYMNIENPQYPELIVGLNNLGNYFSRCGQGNLLDASGGGMSFTGSKLVGTVDGTYTTGEVYLETWSADVGQSTAANLQVNSGNIYIKSNDAYIKGTGTAANSGNIHIVCGNPAGTGTQGSIYLDGKIMYAHGGTAILNSTLNVIVGIGDVDLLNSSGTVYHKNITANTNFQFLNGVPGKRFTVVVKNATGSSWQANFPTVKQKAGTIINTVSANSSSIFEFVNSSNEYYCISCINNMV